MNSTVNSFNYVVEPSEADKGYVVRFKVKPFVGVKLTKKMLTFAKMRQGKGSVNTNGIMVYPDKNEAVRIATRFDTYLTQQTSTDGA